MKEQESLYKLCCQEGMGKMNPPAADIQSLTSFSEATLPPNGEKMDSCRQVQSFYKNYFYPIINSSIFFTHFFHEELISRAHFVKDKHRDDQPFTLAPTDNLKSPVNPACMILVCGRTCKLHRGRRNSLNECSSTLIIFTKASDTSMSGF